MRILFAILSTLSGLALVFGGYRLARLFIPLLGFVAGLSLGGAVMADMSSTPFLGTALGIIVGLVAGLLLAALAYLYYFLAVIVLAGSLGYWAGSGLIVALGFNPGLLSALVGIGLGIVVGLVALFVNAPKYVLIIFTSLVGSVLAIGGILLLFNQIPLDLYSYTTASASISNSFIWSAVTLVLFIIGMTAQFALTQDYEFEKWTLGENQGNLTPPKTPRAPGHP